MRDQMSAPSSNLTLTLDIPRWDAMVALRLTGEVAYISRTSSRLCCCSIARQPLRLGDKQLHHSLFNICFFAVAHLTWRELALKNILDSVKRKWHPVSLGRTTRKWKNTIAVSLAVHGTAAFKEARINNISFHLIIVCVSLSSKPTERQQYFPLHLDCNYRGALVDMFQRDSL